MKQKITPNSVVNFLTPEEFASHMQDHTNTLLKALGRNAQFKRLIEGGNVQANGLNCNLIVSPPDGFMWDVRGVKLVTSLGSAGAINMYLNDKNSSINLLDSLKSTDALSAHTYNKTIIAHSMDQIVFEPQAPIGVNEGVTAIFYVIEVPNSHEAQLLL